MDDPNLIQWLVGQAGIGGLAAFALYTLNTNHQASLRREREYAEQNREDKLRLMDVVGANAQAMAELRTTMQVIVYGRERQEETGVASREKGS